MLKKLFLLTIFMYALGYEHKLTATIFSNRVTIRSAAGFLTTAGASWLIGYALPYIFSITAFGITTKDKFLLSTTYFGVPLVCFTLAALVVKMNVKKMESR